MGDNPRCNPLWLLARARHQWPSQAIATKARKVQRARKLGRESFQFGNKVRVAERRENGLKEKEKEQKRREQDSIETGQRRLATEREREKECTFCFRDVEEFDGVAR